MLREIFQEPPIISYRKGCSRRRPRESKIIIKERKLGILWRHLGLLTPIYTGALIKPVSKANEYLLMFPRLCES